MRCDSRLVDRERLLNPDARDLVGEVRRAFRALAAAEEALHGDLGVTAAMRAVLEALGNGPRTVPAVAGDRRVSRQHIQQVVNALYAAGLAEPRGNRHHRRSHLVAATARGREVLAEMRRREAELRAELASELDAEQMTAAAATLNELSGLLERRLDQAAPLAAGGRA
jgi:DNA-binding MarR family transcriptional regulator